MRKSQRADFKYYIGKIVNFLYGNQIQWLN